MDDLYKEFNALKAHLGDLTEKFGPIETFIDELKAERASGGVARASTPQADPSAPNLAPAAPTRRRILKKKTTTTS